MATHYIDVCAPRFDSVKIDRERRVAQVRQCRSLAVFEVCSSAYGVGDEHAGTRPVKRVVPADLPFENPVV